MNHELMFNRFRGYFPVIVDVETTGLDPLTNGILEIAAVTLVMDNSGYLQPGPYTHYHIEPFKGCVMDPKSLEFNKIIPDHPLRFAVTEADAMDCIFKFIRDYKKEGAYNRAILVGHNAWFDLHFMNAATNRCNIKRSPFHPFSSIDTASLGAMLYGQTVLAKAIEAAGIHFDIKQAHGALYDAQKTAELFCAMANRYKRLGGWPLDK